MKADDAIAALPPFSAEQLQGGVRLSGALVFASATAAFRQLVGLLPSSGSLAVDLSGLAASDSAGLATLVEWRAQAIRRGVHLRFSRPNADLRALARLSDLDAELFQ
jgi:ABC-type transporter Mla MlaB component